MSETQKTVTDAELIAQDFRKTLSSLHNFKLDLVDLINQLFHTYKEKDQLERLHIQSLSDMFRHTLEFEQVIKAKQKELNIE